MGSISDEQTEFIDLLMAEREIARVIQLASRASDRKDLSIQRACYHDDALDNHGFFKGAVDDFFAWLPGHHENFDIFMHLMGAPSIEVQGTRAYAETYCFAITRIKAQAVYTLEVSPLVMHGCRYLDEFELRAGSWKIAKRSVVFEWSRTDWSTPAEVPGQTDSQIIRGHRSRDDLIYVLGGGVLMSPPD